MDKRDGPKSSIICRYGPKQPLAQRMSQDVLSLDRISESLIGRVWPASHVLVGMLVNKGVRQILEHNAQAVRIAPKRYLRIKATSQTLPNSMQNYFSRWTNAAIAIEVDFRTLYHCTSPELSVLFVDGLREARASGWSGAIESLNISVHMRQLCTLQYCAGLKRLELGVLGAFARPKTDLGRLLELGLQTCSRLETLKLDWSDIDYECCSHIAVALSKNPCITELDLTGNQDLLSTEGALALQGPLGGGAICGLVGAQCTLTNLNLEYCQMGEDGIRFLAPVLAASSALTSLNLASNQLEHRGGVALAAALAESGCKQTLKQMDLFDNYLGSAAWRGIAHVLAQCPALEAVNVVQNELQANDLHALLPLRARLRKLSSSHDEALGVESVQVLGMCSVLEELVLTSTPLGGPGARALASALRGAGVMTGGLKGLTLIWREADATVTSEVAALLMGCAALTRLCLNDNRMGVAGVREVSASLTTCRVLAHLHLAKNDIGDDGAKILAAALAHLVRLESLCLSGNGIRVDGSVALAQALGGLLHLEGLSLDCNPIQDQGATALAACLCRSERLGSLRLERCGLSDEGARAILQSVTRGRGLRVALADNSIDPGTVAALGLHAVSPNLDAVYV